MSAARRIRTYRDVADPAREDIVAQVGDQRRRLAERLAEIERVVVVASGKGGVGKSAVAANLTALLAARGWRVGAADGDLNGPSLARMLGARREPLAVGEDGVRPAIGAAGAAVVSTDLLLDEDAPTALRGPAAGGAMARGVVEAGILREFLADVAWGQLDLLVVDLPPGTDRLERLLGLVPEPDLLLLVTTPSDMARRVVARSVTAARSAGLGRMAIVANMTHLECPGCGQVTDLYEADAARALAEAAGLPLAAEIPFDPALAAATDRGRPLALERPDAPAARALAALADRVAALPSRRERA